MPGRYGQYCPLALATEILGERWTILVVMQLIEGTTRFNDLRRALPKIPPSTLSARLRSLEQADLVVRKPGRRGAPAEYAVTDGCRELEPVLNELAFWGQRWARDMEPDDLDPEFLAWSMHKRIDVGALPPGRVVVEFEFTGVPDRMAKRFWILKHEERLDVCIQHPGHDVDLRVRADLRRFVETWRGFRPLRAELRAGRIRLDGSRELMRSLPRWLLLSVAAQTERRRPGRERAAYRRARGS